jgi:hypothetical protein
VIGQKQRKNTVSEKPKAGEWWEKEGVRLRVIGEKRNGLTVGEHECGSIDLFRSQDGWSHLPHCTGFDWVEPPTEDTAYLLAEVARLKEQLGKTQQRVDRLERDDRRERSMAAM